MHLRTNGSERYFAACATTHIPQVQLDRVLLCECDHRADELIGLKVDVSGELIADFELVFVQEAKKKITLRLFSQSPTRHLLSRTARALFSAAQSQCSHRGHHTHRARPPAPRFLLRRPPVIFFSMAVPRRDFCAQSTWRQLKSTKTNTTALIFPVKVRWL